MRLLGMVTVVIFVGWFEVDDGSPDNRLLTKFSRRTRMNPGNRFRIVAVPALIAEDLKPFFIVPLLPGKVHPGWMSRCKQFGSITENGSPDSLPFCGLTGVVTVVARENEQAVGRSIALDLKCHKRQEL